MEKHNDNYEIFIAYKQNNIHKENIPIDYTKIHTAQGDDVKLKSSGLTQIRKYFMKQKCTETQNY